VEVALAAVVGIAAGLVGAVVQAVVQITQKRLRNNRYIRLGEPPVKDVMFNPLFAVFAIGGGIGGLIAGAAGGSWTCGALGGSVLPAIATVGWLVGCVLQLRR
jgi:hypothetical protein